MTPVWTAQALEDVSAIVTRIGQDDPHAATQLLDRIEETATTVLPANPLMGRPGRVDGTREFVLHRSYILVYRVQADRLDILTVRHTARSWPDRLQGVRRRQKPPFLTATLRHRLRNAV